jgi:hypothetical protein
VTPRTSCALSSGDLSQATTVFADDSGGVHFNITPMQEGAGTLFLDCVAGNGSLQRYPLQLTATTDPVAIATSNASMKSLATSRNGTLRPALTGDPMSYASGDLLVQGYGVRPDPVLHPDAYAAWLAFARAPGIVVSGRSVVDTGHTNGPNENRHVNEFPQGGGGWSGAVEHKISASMVNVFASFTVPQVFAESNIGNHSSASSWVGLGGTGTDLPLWQTGVEEYTQTLLFFETSQYTPWWELFPGSNNGSQTTLPNMNVNNGDAIQVQAWVCDPTEGFTSIAPGAPNAHLCASMSDLTQSESWFSWTANPAVRLSCDNTPATVCGTTSFTTAEVIQEWPLTNGGVSDYAQFNQFAFSGTGAIDANFNEANSIGGPSSNDPFTTQMWQIGTGSRIVGGSCIGVNPPACSDTGNLIWVNWVSHK